MVEFFSLSHRTVPNEAGDHRDTVAWYSTTKIKYESVPCSGAPRYRRRAVDRRSGSGDIFNDHELGATTASRRPRREKHSKHRHRASVFKAVKVSVTSSEIMGERGRLRTPGPLA